jgi:NDP-sugar pyrophosphorylase family protein/aminoglycoside/choline kinase family phosphotransferase
MSINLFIPAAGLGTRLRPLTELAPKPLLPIAGIPLIQRIIEQAKSQLTILKVGINTHYMPETVGSWLKSFPLQSEIFHETDILGTGGALKNAASFLKQGTFIVVNGDVLSGMDWQALLKTHRESNNLVTLAVQNREHERRVGVDENFKLKIIDKECATDGIAHWFGYACAAVYEPEFLEFLPEGESHVVPYWVDAAEKTGRVGVYDIGRETYWLDLGTPESFAQASVDVLMVEKRFLKEPLNIPWDCQLDGTVIVEDRVEIGEQVSLKNTILLPGTKVADGSKLENVIAGPGFTCPVDWPSESTSLVSCEKIGQGGSDRVYTRQKDRVVLYYSAFEENIERQMELTTAFLQCGVNVPEIYRHVPMERLLELEDLGDETLRQWLSSVDDPGFMLQQILDQLFSFQFTDESLCPSIHERVFNYETLRWETSYFLERFVKRVCGIDHDFSAVQEEFSALALEVDSLPKRIMHRDFQSENIMIKKEKPWLIDFQGAHWGPPFFDLVSFLKDPYVSYPKTLVEELEEDYLEKLGAEFEMSLEQCRRAVLLCGMQRHMQALGAYGFLTHIRGKEDFLKYCRPAYDLLRTEVEALKSEFPHLMKLLDALKENF